MRPPANRSPPRSSIGNGRASLCVQSRRHACGDRELVRRRAVPAGTVGGRMPCTKTPSPSRRSAHCIAARSSPITIGATRIGRPGASDQLRCVRSRPLTLSRRSHSRRLCHIQGRDVLCADQASVRCMNDEDYPVVVGPKTPVE